MDLVHVTIVYVSNIIIMNKALVFNTESEICERS